ncbi:DUF2391 domain-containing protein [Halomicrobium salinisoli]|uniref:DUF2391 domain-containing protein n=1 Tax=Halomicrobium salinisoli TaxID=2878391 RepID=UPI001CF0BB8F|nr:DUF2391 domain-containing protein [Halomicrobium salinisoli]
MSRKQRPPIDDEDEPDMGDLFDDLQHLESLVDSEDERERVREAMQTATEVQDADQAVFGRVVWGFGAADAAEAVLGALLFGIPMAVEGGTNEAAEFLTTRPLYLAGTLLAGVAIVIGILYVAEFQDVRVANPILGFIPRRLAGVTVISFSLAVVLLTAWGRVDWAQPWLAFCTCAVAFFPMAIGAALGDILPGS